MINSISYSSAIVEYHMLFALVVQGVVDVYIGANPSAEGCGEDKLLETETVRLNHLRDHASGTICSGFKCKNKEGSRRAIL
ncbi:hypothetical protein Tco_1309622 [Tanacetum coccineum]